jgi:uncharacterized protein (DUF1778 family)
MISEKTKRNAGDAMANRAALLIRCSKYDAEFIRAQAKLERRSISGFVLRIVSRALDFEESLEGRFLSRPPLGASGRNIYAGTQRKIGPRTAILLRCSTDEAARIRAAARRSHFMISEYVLHCVRRTLAESQ